METVYLGLGANRGEAARTIRAAFAELSRLLDAPRLSSLWRSRARYYEDQPDFVNAVAAGETSLSPRELLAAIHRIEADFGRDRSVEISKGPRPLDIDILLFGARIIAESDLIVPHAGLRERKFALLPLLELEPSLADPVSGTPYAELLALLPAQGIYLLDEGGYDLIHV
ncbi:MAG: 2-amino-4-hydroxy-6-hydroxymethyldihydropteridine diphosphokinase [Spirochaetaceae bacterium]|nr:2-amino-4-hydroxy-6-hydroxymethyldihydropteridine diphosphokinase [Spirochaetaceae bacterium]